MVLLLCSTEGLWAQTPEAASAPAPASAEAETLLQQGLALIKQGRSAEALDPLERGIKMYDSTFDGEKRRIYAARSTAEGLLYLSQAATAHQAAVLVSPTWAYLFYGKGFALKELHREDEARTWLERALEMSPGNAQFLEEVGDSDTRQKHFDAALEDFRRAADAAALSPPAAKNLELLRAWRGVGYILVERHQLDEAEAMYRKCIAYEPGDTKAIAELNYVLSLKAKPTGVVAGASSDAARHSAAGGFLEAPSATVFLFGRANFYRVLAEKRHCEAVDRALLLATNERFERARKRLAALYGEVHFQADPSVGPTIRDDACDDSALHAYASHVTEVEHALEAAADQ